MSGKRSSIRGLGINDANYMVAVRVDGKVKTCKFYRTWIAMFNRCYSSEFHKKQPRYSDCYVCDEWFSFMAFRSWMRNQRWEGMQLDKDVLFSNNKVYSPKTCAFITQKTNTFINKNEAIRGDLKIGVSWSRLSNKFYARCGNPISMKRECLGYFESEVDAYNSWLKRKHEIACELSSMERDERVKLALRKMYKLTS